MAFGARTGAGWVGMRSAYVRGQQSGHGTGRRRSRRIRVGIVDGHVRRTGTPEVDKINENDIVEWTRKSPFGYATQVYRVLQAAL
jgi:hypothetical protein